MNVTVEEINSVKKKINVEIPDERVAQEMEAIYRELGKQARIKGFRPGKVPRAILERYFKDYIKSEVIQKLIQETYSVALSEKGLQPVSPPVFDPGDLEKGKPYTYSATVEVKPEIRIEGYTGLKIQGRKEEVTEEEVEERLKGLQELHAQLRTISESRPVQAGDHVIFDYEARRDGQPLPEGRAIDFTVEVGSGRFIPALEEKMIGMRPEEEREIEVSFPEDYGYKKWAGQTISFRIKVKEIKEKVLPPLDDEFAKDLGDYDSLAALKARLKEELEKEKAAKLDRALKDQLIEHLLEANRFDIPETLVEEQVKALLSDTRLRLAAQGVAWDQLNLSEEKLRDDYREVAKRQVRTYLILEKIADQEGIRVTDEDVEERLRSISERTHQKFDVVKRYYESNGLIPDLKAGILTDKTLNFLLSRAEIS
ncbi:MAG: trigger factor [Desulfobacterota bacterium]|nr:trigger factor [Thermodesulfobacteriota bacterium]